MPGNRDWSRREFLKGVGAAIALPYFPSLFPYSSGNDEVKPPKRLMFMCVPLGFVPNKTLFDCPDFEAAGSKGWFPDEAGPLVKMPEVHASLEPYRDHVSFLRGLCNRKFRGDVHKADDAYLTCADTLADPAKNFSNTVSCDQVAAASKTLGSADVRHRSLSLGVAALGLSWVENGTPITPMTSPAKVFDMLFGNDDVPASIRMMRLQEKKSFLDVTLDQVKDLNRDLNDSDRHKLDEATSAVREAEKNIQREEGWIQIKKPSVAFARPEEPIAGNSVRHAHSMFELAHAAFLTDTTRVITYGMPSTFSEVSPFIKHALNHDLTPERAADAIKVDRAMTEQLAFFAKLLCDSREQDGQPLMHHALISYGAALWGPNHSIRNLPLMLLGHGGGMIKQGMSRWYEDGTPLANLWLTMLTAAGVPLPDKSFADSTGVLQDLLDP